MRAMKKTVSLLLTIVMVIGMVTIAVSAAGAATNTVSVTSNVGSTGSISYVPGTTQKIAVTFKLWAKYYLVSTEGAITFDPAVLKVSSDTTASNFAPNMGMVQVNLNKSGKIPFNASNPGETFNFKNSEQTPQKVYVTVVFDVIGSGDTTVDLTVTNITGTRETANHRAESSENDLDIINYTVNKTSWYKTSVELVATPDISAEVTDFIKSRQVEFAGKVGVLFGFIKPEGYENRTVSAKLTSAFSNQVVDVPFDDTTWNASRSRYMAPEKYLVRSTEATQPITITIYVDGAELGSTTYKAIDYVKGMLTRTDIADNFKTLCKAYADYCAKAQIYFQKYTDDLANAGIDYTAPTVSKTDVQSNSIYEITGDLSTFGLGTDTRAGIYESDTAIRNFFVVTDQTKLNKTTVKYNHVKQTAAIDPNNSSRVYFDITDIGSNALAKLQMLVFTSGSTKVYYKVNMNYLILKGLDNSNARYKNLCKALYNYGKAAEDYFGAAA